MALRKLLDFRTEASTAPKASMAEAAEQAGLLIRGLQSRLNGLSGDPGPIADPGTIEDAPIEEPVKPAVDAAQNTASETAEDLDRQLQEFFEKSTGSAASSSVLNDIRNRVIEGVVDRILRDWERSQARGATPLENEVVERLIRRVIGRLSADD